MRAVVVESFGAPVQVRDLPVPSPGEGEVLVRIEASGLCHTDLHAASGDWPVKPSPPFTPGHEGVGIVEETGPGVTTRTVGERVAIPWLGYACGECEFCVSGRETLCPDQRNSGYAVDGAWAELAVANARFTVPVPEGVSPQDAAPLSCAGLTTYKAVKAAGVGPSQLVAVFGIGGLGHLAVQYAKIAGAIVIAVDLEDSKLDLARELGADHVVNARTQDPVETIQDLGGAHAAIALAVAPSAFEQAFTSLRKGGTLVAVALPADGVLPVPLFPLVTGEITVVGSNVGTRQDLAEVFALHAAGRTRVISDVRDLSRAAASMEDMRGGRVLGRVVFTMDGAGV